MTHVLIIDDNQSNINVLGLLLEQENITYISLTDPEQITSTLDNNPDDLDIVFLDIEFPNQDGIELLPYLKSLPQLTNVPIVAYSVHISEIDVTRKAGFDGFLGKPLDAINFPEHVQRILNGEQVWII